MHSTVYIFLLIDLIVVNVQSHELLQSFYLSSIWRNRCFYV